MVTRLEALNKDLGNFTFMASHDLQEPLRKIQTFSDLLHFKYKEVLDADAILHITRIQKSAHRMQTLIKDILDFSRLKSQRKDFVYGDLNLIIQEVIAEMQSSIQEKNARIEVSSLPSLMINPRLIRTLFHNLIGNALKYAGKEASPVIRIFGDPDDQTAESSDASRKKYCRVHVQDNGLGFDQKYSEQIFDMFRRLHTGPEFEGTGIGLTLCKKIVSLHNGSISASSKVNEGSTFIISLPYTQPDSSVEPPPAVPVKKAASKI